MKKHKFNSEVFNDTELEGLTEDQIFEKYMHHVPATIQKKFPDHKNFMDKHGLDMDDLTQFGYIGLMNAIRSYNPNKSKLLTHVINNIQWEIIRQAKKNSLYSISNYSFEFAGVDSLHQTLQGVDGEQEDELIDCIDAQDYSIEESDYNVLVDHFQSELPERVCEFIKLKMKNYTNQEIGDMYGLSRQAVSAAIIKHRDEIRHLLKDVV